MKLKGELDSIGVTELFKTLADQRATGVLVVNSPMGEKTIALSHGEIAICADHLTEKTRLGDLLVARGKISEDQLASALKTQRLDPRAKLGDVLVKQGTVSPELIAEAIRFQVEEQIIDLFTWKDATFEFDSDKSVDDVYDPDGNGNPIQRLSVNTQPLLAEAAKRTEMWKQIQQRIPTPYLCFKIAPKGEELVSKAQRSTQQIVKLLKEGRTLETTIKKSCLGRFNVCTAVMKMLDDAWIFPIPANELRFLASEHRFKKRFLDALYIYRRLLETTSVEAERGELEKQIQDTIDAIHAAATQGETPEGAEIVSYREAAQRYVRRRKIRRISLAVFGSAGSILALFIVLSKYAPKVQLSEDYKKAINNADQLVSDKKYEEAIKLWDDFYKNIPDKGSDTASYVRQRESSIIKKLDNYIEEQFKQAADTEKAKNYSKAETLYAALIEKYPTSSFAPQSQEAIDRIKQILKNNAAVQARDEQDNRVKAALALLDQKQIAPARKALEKVLAEVSVDSDWRPKIEAALKTIDEMDERAKVALTAARAELASKRGDKAIEAFDQVIREGSDAPGFAQAKEARQELQLKLDKLREEFKRGKKEAEAEGGAVIALDILSKAQRDYPEFEHTRDGDELRAEIEKLNVRVAGLNDELKKAQDLMKTNRAQGIVQFQDLLQHEFAFLATKNVKIPVLISSSPTGALVKLDGNDLGRTPLEVSLPVSGSSTLRLEHDDYEAFEQRFTRLMPDQLTKFHTTLKRKPLAVIDLDGPSFAPPRLINGSIFVLNGTSLTVFDPSGKEVRGHKVKLFSDEATTRPAPDGSGPLMVEKNWWYPRAAPEPFKADKAFLILRTCDILSLSLNLSSLQTQKLVTLPSVPVGAPYLEEASILAGKPLLAVGCEDGLIYIIDLQTGKMLEKGSPVQADPRKEKKTSLATGLVSYAPGSFVSLSISGWLRCFKIHDGTLVNEVDLHGEVAADNVLPTGSESIAPIVMKDGRVMIVNVREQRIVGQIPAVQSKEVTHAVMSSDGLYVMDRLGVLRKYELTSDGQPKSIWEQTLDGPSKIPFVVNKSVFVATDAHTIWSLKPKTGERIWQYHSDDEASQMSLIGDLLYITTPTGRLLILKTSE